jgi:hypothetical protein
VLG